ncbi:MAG: hypothetical protein GEU75_13545 [Dehalococcoidia bacterium]|nr:hypothetical protein [Dehalococcoidia bacterium]
MNQAVTDNKTLQVQELDLKAKLAVAEGALAWYEMRPGGTVEDAQQLKGELASQIAEIAAKRSALLQQMLSTSFGGE